MTIAVLETPTTKASTEGTLAISLVALQKAMATVAPAVERKTTIPVLSNVRIEQAEQHIEFTATNLDLSIRVRVGTQTPHYHRPILLPALKLEAFSKLLQGDTVTVKLVGNAGSRAEMRCGRSVTKVPNSDVHGFPALKFGSGETGVQLPLSEAERLLGFTTFAVSDVADRYTLNGALLDVSEGRLSLVATDGHRLARYSVPTDEDATSLLLPAAFLRAIEKTIDGGVPALLTIDQVDEAVFANVGDRTGEIALTHRKMVGQFPNYRAVLPRTLAATITVDADAMRAALRRCMAFADQGTNAIRILVGGAELKLNGSSVDAGETDEVVDVLSVSSAGEIAPFKIGFSAKYLLDGFSRLSGHVQMRFSALDSSNAMTIYAEPAEGEAFEYVVMPMRV